MAFGKRVIESGTTIIVVELPNYYASHRRFRGYTPKYNEELLVRKKSSFHSCLSLDVNIRNIHNSTYVCNQ